jgi:predicted nucleic acid-binding protein
MEQYLIDTNVVSDYFSASFPAKGMEFMDSVIAGTAIAHGLTLITNDEKDFNNIKGLKIINPYTVL